MANKKYVSLNRLSTFLDNLKESFATKSEMNNKSDKTHIHNISDITNLQSALNGKADSSHGTHVTYSATAPVMDGVASVGSASTVARSDHRHPSDTSRASKTEFDSHNSDTTTHITDAERNKWNAAYTHSQATHAPSTAEPNQNAFSNVKIGDTVITADIKTDTLTLVAGNNITLTPDTSGDSITITSKDTNTTYSAGTGISLSGTTFSNSGVRSVSTGSTNGTISVNTNGTSANVAVKGLGSAAYTATTAYDAAGTAQTKADAALASAKTYADTAANKVKSDLLNGAGTAYDTLKELGDLIDDNTDAIEALNTVAASKANATDLTSHTSNKSNPHGVTLTQLGITATASELNKMDGITATTSELNILDGVTANTTEINYLDGVTSGIQAQLDAKQATVTGGATTITSNNLTASRALISNSSGKVAVSNVTSTELEYLDGVTSNLQTQLDAKASSSHTHNYAGSSSAGGAATSANKLNTNAGSATQPVYFSNGIPVATTYTLNKSVPSNAVFTDTHYTSKNVVGATNATSNTASALTNGNVYLNSVENGAVTSSHKISGSGATTVTTDTAGNIIISSTDNNTTYNAAGSALGLVKSGGDVIISSGVITVNDDSHNHTISNVDNLQSSLDAKQATITGGASTITTSNLTTNRALISNGSGKVAVSDVTSTELSYLDGVTSGIQAQLDGKAASSHNHSAANITSGTISSDRLPTVPISKGGTGATTAANAIKNLGAVAVAQKSYTSFGTASTSTDGWYTLFTINDSTNGSAICLLKGYAHSSVIFSVTKGYSTNASLNILDCNTSLNNSYAYIKALRVLSDGKVQAKINTGTVNMNIHIISANGWITPVDSLVCDTSNLSDTSTPSICVTRTLTHGKIIAGGFIGDLSGNATTATTASNVAWSGVTSKPSYYDAKAIKSITRSGTTFTYTCMDGTTGTFTQQDNDTNTKVTNTLATTTKAYVTGTTSASTNTGTQVFDTGVYLDTTAGQLTATTFNGTTFKGSGLATLAEVQDYLGL